MTTTELMPELSDFIISASTIMSTEYPPLEYVVPNLIPEGLTILVAAPKIGKSWMVLGIANAAANGSKVFGALTVTKRPVLYLALEDGERRLKSRLRKIGAPVHNPNLSLVIDSSYWLPVMRKFLSDHANERPLVILDTLGKVKGAYKGNDAYANDYMQMSALKDEVDRVPGSSLIVVHHTNKGEKTDFLDTVSGTQGLAGAADSILAIKRERNTNDSTLFVTSREAAEGEYSMTMTDGVWKLNGATLKEAAQNLEAKESVAGLGDDMTRLVNLVISRPEGIKPKDLVTALNMDENKVSGYLKRAYDGGRISKQERGKYGPIPLPNTSPL